MIHDPELLSAFLDGELTDAEAVWVSEHVESCGTCRIELEDLASARAAVRSLPLLDLPDGVVPVSEPELVARRVSVRRAVAAASLAVAAMAAAVAGVGALADQSVFVDGERIASVLAASSSLGLEIPEGSEVGRYLHESLQAEFTARRTTSCRTPDGIVDSTVDLTRLSGVTVVSDPLGDPAVITRGSVSTGPVNGPVETTTLTGPRAAVDPGYRVASVEEGEVRGRPIEVVEVERAGVVRAVLHVDTESRAIIGQEIRNADGTVACRSELVEFDSIDTPVRASLPFPITAQVVERVLEPVATDLPETLAGMRRTAAYPADDGVVAVYSDGVLSAAVAVVDGVPDMPSTTLGEAGQSMNIWEAGGRGFAVIGALPDDVLGEVLAALPAPRSDNVLVRGWRALTG